MSASRAVTIYAAGNVLSAGVPFLLLPLLTRVLPPAQYGAVVNFFLLLSACTAVAGLGMHGALGVRWFKEEPAYMPRIVGTGLVIAVLSTLAVAIVLGAVVALLPAGQLGFGPGVGALAAIAAGCNVVLQCRLVLWQNEQRPIANVALQFAGSLLNVSLSLVAVLALGWGAMGRIVGATLAGVIVAAFAVLLLVTARQVRLQLRWSDARSLIGFGAPLVPHSMAGVMLSNADRFVVSAMLGPATLGTYGAAAQLGAIMSILADAFVKAFNPWLFGRLASGRPREELRVVGAIYAAIPGFFVLAALVGTLLVAAGRPLLGPEYRSALGLVPWFVLGGAFSGIYLAVSGLYFYYGRTAMLSGVTFPTSLIGLACTVGLVASFGATGAAAGYALTQALLSVAAGVVARRTFRLPWHQPRYAVRSWREPVVPEHVER